MHPTVQYNQSTTDALCTPLYNIIKVQQMLYAPHCTIMELMEQPCINHALIQPDLYLDTYVGATDMCKQAMQGPFK